MAGATLDIRPRVLQTPETVRYEFNLDYSSSSRTKTLFYEFARDLERERRARGQIRRK